MAKSQLEITQRQLENIQKRIDALYAKKQFTISVKLGKSYETLEEFTSKLRETQNIVKELEKEDVSVDVAKRAKSAFISMRDTVKDIVSQVQTLNTSLSQVAKTAKTVSQVQANVAKNTAAAAGGGSSASGAGKTATSQTDAMTKAVQRLIERQNKAKISTKNWFEYIRILVRTQKDLERQTGDTSNRLTRFFALVAGSRAFRPQSSIFAQLSGVVNQLTGNMVNLIYWQTRWYATRTIIFGTVNAIKGAFDSFVEFDQELKNIQAITSAANVEIASLERTILDVASSTKFGLTELAKAGTVLAQSGLTIAEVNVALPQAAILATATLTDLNTTTQLITSSMRAFGLELTELARLSDIFANAVSNSKLTIDKIATSFNYVGPVAKQVGLDLDDTATALALLANKGIQASTIGTSLRTLFGALLAPTDKFKDELRAVGLTIGDVNPQLYNMGEIIDRLNRSGFNINRAFAGLDRRAAGALASLIQDGAVAFETMNENINRTGTASLKAQRQLTGLAQLIDVIRQNVETLLVTLEKSVLGDELANALTKIRNLIQDFNTSLQDSPDLLKRLRDQILSISETIVTGLGTLIGAHLISGILSSLTTGIGTAIGASGVFGTVGTALGGPIGGAIGIAAATAFGYVFTKNIVNTAKDTWKDLGSSTEALEAGRRINDALDQQINIGRFQTQLSVLEAKFSELGFTSARFNREFADLLSSNSDFLESINVNYDEFISKFKDRTAVESIGALNEKLKETSERLEDITAANQRTILLEDVSRILEKISTANLRNVTRDLTAIQGGLGLATQVVNRLERDVQDEEVPEGTSFDVAAGRQAAIAAKRLIEILRRSTDALFQQARAEIGNEADLTVEELSAQLQRLYSESLFTTFAQIRKLVDSSNIDEETRDILYLKLSTALQTLGLDELAKITDDAAKVLADNLRKSLDQVTVAAENWKRQFEDIFPTVKIEGQFLANLGAQAGLDRGLDILREKVNDLRIAYEAAHDSEKELYRERYEAALAELEVLDDLSEQYGKLAVGAEAYRVEFSKAIEQSLKITEGASLGAAQEITRINLNTVSELSKAAEEGVTSLKEFARENRPEFGLLFGDQADTIERSIAKLADDADPNLKLLVDLFAKFREAVNITAQRIELFGGKTYSDWLDTHIDTTDQISQYVRSLEKTYKESLTRINDSITNTIKVQELLGKAEFSKSVSGLVSGLVSAAQESIKTRRNLEETERTLEQLETRLKDYRAEFKELTGLSADQLNDQKVLTTLTDNLNDSERERLSTLVATIAKLEEERKTTRANLELNTQNLELLKAVFRTITIGLTDLDRQTLAIEHTNEALDQQLDIINDIIEANKELSGTNALEDLITRFDTLSLSTVEVTNKAVELKDQISGIYTSIKDNAAKSVLNEQQLNADRARVAEIRQELLQLPIFEGDLEGEGNKVLQALNEELRVLESRIKKREEEQISIQNSNTLLREELALRNKQLDGLRQYDTVLKSLERGMLRFALQTKNLGETIAQFVEQSLGNLTNTVSGLLYNISFGISEFNNELKNQRDEAIEEQKDVYAQDLHNLRLRYAQGELDARQYHATLVEIEQQNAQQRYQINKEYEDSKKDLWGETKDAFKNFLKDWLKLLLDTLTRAITEALVLKAIMSIGGAAIPSPQGNSIYGLFGQARAKGGPIKKYATGGEISGYIPGTAGTPNKDSVLAALMPGEYIVKKSSVERYGEDLFHALNSQLIDVSKLPRFAEGGTVSKTSSNRSTVTSAAGDKVVIYNLIDPDQLPKSPKKNEIINVIQLDAVTNGPGIQTLRKHMRG